MAKGKKASGKHYVSKGQRPNVSKDARKAMAADRNADLIARRMNQLKAWKKGKKVNDPELMAMNPKEHQYNIKANTVTGAES